MRSLWFGASAFALVLASGVPWAIAQPCCSGSGPEMMGPGMMGGGMMRGRMAGSMPRHRQAMMAGIPRPYDIVQNPLPNTEAAARRGAAVFAANCASCHGATGHGDGSAGKDLDPPPADLAWFSRMPMSRWDPFLYWTIAEGGKQFDTAMPAFKDALSKDDIWAVITYVQQELGASNPARGR